MAVTSSIALAASPPAALQTGSSPRPTASLPLVPGDQVGVDDGDATAVQRKVDGTPALSSLPKPSDGGYAVCQVGGSAGHFGNVNQGRRKMQVLFGEIGVRSIVLIW
jgi:hypothetical protein